MLSIEHGLVGRPAAIREYCTVSEDSKAWVSAIAKQVARNARFDDASACQLRETLDKNYFGISVCQVADLIRAG